MLKVTKCIGVKSFAEALINMVCELKITSGCKKKLCKNFMVIKKLCKNFMVIRVISEKHGYVADEMHSRF